MDAEKVAPAKPYRIVDNEYQSGVHTPDWWDEAYDGNTVFVPSTLPGRVKDAALREYARRQGKTLRTRRETIDGEAGTVYWMTTSAQNDGHKK